MPKLFERAELSEQIESIIHMEALMDDKLSDDELVDDIFPDHLVTSDSSDTDSEEDFLDDDFLLDEIESGDLFELYQLLTDRRYVIPREWQLRSHEFVDKFFRDLPDHSFRQFTRMDRHSFLTLVDMIADHPIFVNESYFKQGPIFLQLAVSLDRFGHHGNGACIRRSQAVWGVGHGTMVNYTKRVVIALQDRLKHFVKWPDRYERQRTSDAFAQKGFSGCVELLDGTLLPLTQRPRDDGETYFNRKSRYSINAQVVCDHTKKIFYCFAGMPGSCHDFNCLKKSRLWSYLQDDLHFDEGQFLLCDSAYSPQRSLVPAFRQGSNDPDQQAFNICVANARVVNENCIGLLKSRWFSLKEMRTQLKN